MRLQSLLYLAVPAAFAALTSGCQTLNESPDFFKEFPAATSTKFYTGADALAAVNAGQCVVLTSQRTYVAPQGWTERTDVLNAAKGVDAAVNLDGGNAYRVVSYNWIPAELGTALAVTFDTLLCKPATQPAATPPAPAKGQTS